MSVGHLNYCDCCHQIPVEPPVWLQRERRVSRSKNESIRSIEIERDLVRPISLQLVAASWQRSHHTESRGCRKVVQTMTNELGALPVTAFD